jgi:hypothetical protein
MSAAAASRDITLFHAMDLLHASGYDFARGALALVDHGAPRSANQIYLYQTGCSSKCCLEAFCLPNEKEILNVFEAIVVQETVLGIRIRRINTKFLQKIKV